MPMIRRSCANDVDIGIVESFSHILDELRPTPLFFRNLLGAVVANLLVDIDHVKHFSPRIVDVGAQMGTTATANTNDGGPDLVIR